MKWIILLIFVGLFVGFWFFVKPTLFPISIRTDYSEGSCSLTNNKCEWAGDACGGGHEVCSDNPKKYDGVGSICNINNNYPANQGYKCTCLISKGRCGWIK